MDLSIFHSSRRHSWQHTPTAEVFHNNLILGPQKRQSQFYRQQQEVCVSFFKPLETRFLNHRETLEKQLHAVLTTPRDWRFTIPPSPPPPWRPASTNWNLKELTEGHHQERSPRLHLARRRKSHSVGHRNDWQIDRTFFNFAGSGAWPFSVWWGDLSG